MMSDLRDEKWAVGRVADEAKAYLEEQAAKAPPEPPTSEPALPRQPLHGSESVFIYLIRSNHLVKIGLATNLRLRVSNLRVDNPHAVELLSYHEVPRLVGKHIELLLHAVFADRNPGGEWFELAPEHAKAALDKLIAGAKEIKQPPASEAAP